MLLLLLLPLNIYCIPGTELDIDKLFLILHLTVKNTLLFFFPTRKLRILELSDLPKVHSY